MMDPDQQMRSDPDPSSKILLDRLRRPLGRVEKDESDGAEGFRVQLDPEVMGRLGIEGGDWDLPWSMVSSIRRDQVVLDRRLDDLQELLDAMEDDS